MDYRSRRTRAKRVIGACGANRAERHPGEAARVSVVLASAVKDDRLVRNPALGMSLPRVVSAEQRFLTHEQVDALADQCSPHGLVGSSWLTRGLALGEMAALRVGRLDLVRRRALIAEPVTLVRGVQTWGTPKGHERRGVPIPRFLIDELAANVAGKAATDLVFTGTKGGALRAQGFRRAVLTEAAARPRIERFHPHELRHTAASLAIASGANVRVVQQMLGHKSATMTLDLYGHLFGDQLDEVADPAGCRGARCSCCPTVAPSPTDLAYGCSRKWHKLQF